MKNKDFPKDDFLRYKDQTCSDSFNFKFPIVGDFDLWIFRGIRDVLICSQEVIIAFFENVVAISQVHTPNSSI